MMHVIVYCCLVIIKIYKRLVHTEKERGKKKLGDTNTNKQGTNAFIETRQSFTFQNR